MSRKLELGEHDCAMVLEKSGKCQVYMPQKLGVNDDITEAELLMMSITTFIKDPEFVKSITTAYVKNFTAKE